MMRFRDYCARPLPTPSQHEQVTSHLNSCLRVWGLGLRVYSPPLVDRIWGIWASDYNIPKAIFYLLKGDYRSSIQA